MVKVAAVQAFEVVPRLKVGEANGAGVTQ